MPITYTIDEQQNRINAFAHGPIVDEDLAEYTEELQQDPSVHAGMTEFADLSGLQQGEMHLTSNGIRNMVEIEKKSSKKRRNRRIALFSPQDLEFGLTRIYQTYEELENPDMGIEIHVFRDRSEALEWLDAHAI